MDSPVLERVWPPPPTCERALAVLWQIFFIWYLYFGFPFCWIFNSRMAFYHLIYGSWLAILDMKDFTSGKWFHFSLIYLPLQSSLSLLPLTPGALPISGCFYFAWFWVPFSRIFKATAATLGTGESLKRVPWWVPFALAQLPAPSVNWSFKPDTPRRHCDRSFYIFPPSRFTYTRPPFSFFFLLLRCTYCKYMYAVARSPTPPTRAVFPMCPCPKVHKSTVSTLLVWNLSAAWTPSWHSPFFLWLCFLYFQWRNGFPFVLRSEMHRYRRPNFGSWWNT
jgi:hypothetical protein